jgi:excisionase family DNA binding protein
MMEATRGEARATVSATIELMTVKQMAGALGVSLDTCYRLLNDGFARSYVLGPHARLVDAGDVEKLARDGWPDGRRKENRS